VGADPFNHTYAYDTIGNLTSMTGVGSYTYDPAHKHQATAAGSHTFAYDFAGNMTSRTIAGQATQNLVWDESSRLETITQGTTTTGFLYDADGNRVARRDNGVTTVLIDNTFEWSSAGGLVSYYSHAGQVIAMRNTTGLHWMFGDHLGSNSTVRTPAGTNVRQRYLPFGRVRGGASLPTEYGFTGQRLDPSGLMDYNARQYDPILGRFTSPDTIIPDATDPQSFNRYSYVTNNPVNFIDPSGHRAVPDDCYYGGGCGGDSWVGSGKDGGRGGAGGAHEGMGQVDEPVQGPPPPPDGWGAQGEQGRNLMGSMFNWVFDRTFMSANASLLTWGVGVTAQGETLTLDMGEGWAGPKTLLEVFKGRLGAAAISVGFRSHPDEVISDVAYSFEAFWVSGVEVQWGRTTDGSGLFGWWGGLAGGAGAGTTIMRWYSVPLYVLPEE
jgi:RHS repeat-associated protein